MKIQSSWDVFERIYSGHWFLSSYNGPGFVYDFPKIGGGSFITKAIYIMENGTCRYIFNQKEFNRAAHFTADRLLTDHAWRMRIYKKIDYYTTKYFEAGEKLRKLPLAKLTDSKLAAVMKQIIPYQHFHQVYSILVNGVVLDGRNHLSNKMRDELRQAMGNPENFEDHWSLLTLATKMSLRQKKEYAVALLAQHSKRASKEYITKTLRRLHQKYCWLDYNNFGPPASFEQFEKELYQAQKENVYLHLPDEFKAIARKQGALIDHFNLSPRARFIIKLAQHVIWQKGYRKDMQYHGFYCYESYFRELARRRGTAEWKVFAFLFPWEVVPFILEGQPTIAELRERRAYSCFVVTANKKTIKVGKDARLFVGRLGLIENFSQLVEVNGQCAYVGKARGQVKIIQTPADMGKMKMGNILVSQATSPDLLPAMKKASAIVTNTGGLICHAAITARELKIPCVVGTAKATLVFKDGDKVEVDANKGLIRKI